MNEITDILSDRCQLLAMTFALEGASYTTSSIMSPPEYIQLLAGQFMDASEVEIEVVGDKMVVTYAFDDQSMWNLTDMEFNPYDQRLTDPEEPDESETDTAAPQQFIDLHHLADATPDAYTLRINGDGIYMVPQAVVCEREN
ncbi:MAG: hypothetical protein GY940_00670 [bacterium]|nr:hypothetical protein [bacterium]